MLMDLGDKRLNSLTTHSGASVAKFIAVARKFASDEVGATIVEYSLMLALIAVVCIAAVALLGTKTSRIFSVVSDAA